MDVMSTYSALRTALTYGPPLSFLPFFQILIQFLRPDIADRDNRVKIVPQEEISKSYDFIIIGAGSAGSVIANRLTENANSAVLLLEAGGDETLITDVPMVRSEIQGTDQDWQFKTEPSSKYCLRSIDHRCNWPRGKVLGGSSVLNGMLYVRGNKRDYDHWKDLGNSGWGYDDVLPYFKKAENMTIPELRDSPYHGTDGYLTVDYFRYNPPLTKYFLEAGRDMGYEVVNVDAATQTGFTYSKGTLRDGLRCSTAKAYLRSASHRANLHVSMYSLVEKILVDETTKRAYGVQFRREGETYIVHARTEVILSAGAIQSPQILMLSGIGPREHLEDVGIRVIQDIPGVGQNLQDHITMDGLVYSTNVTSDSPIITDEASGGSGNVISSGVDQFFNESRGMLYRASKNGAFGLVNTIFANSMVDFPDMQLGFDGSNNNEGGSFADERHRGRRNDHLAEFYSASISNLTYTITPSLMRPKSKGYIKLRDGQPNHHPIIVPDYYTEPDDLDILIEGAKLAHNISQTPTMRRFNAQPSFTFIAGCANFTFLSDDYWRCHARYHSITGYHPSCTCKMGPGNDSMAVVDSRLRVYGVSALRVVDASIMPNIPTANINAPVVMIAEKAADLIKEDHSSGSLQNRGCEFQFNKS